MAKTIRIVLLAAFALTGCKVEGSRTLLIVKNQPPEEGCVFSATEGELYLGQGIVDTNSPGGYLFTPIARNTAIADDALNPSRRTIVLEGAEVRLTLDSALVPEKEQEALRADGLLEFTQVFTATLAPAGTAGLGFEIIPTDVLEFLAPLLGGERTLVTAEIVIFGKMANESTIESVPFVFPVYVCTDCMVANVGACADVTEDGEAGYPCSGRLQDKLLECCTNSAMEAVCPAAAEMAVR